jgi:acetoin utilization deacetylase AcuC-like enzyme
MAPMVERFHPELVLVSAGYDTHWAERLASMQMTVTGFATITRIIKELADALCKGRLVFSLEGGYDYKALAYSVAATLDVLGGAKAIVDPLGFEPKGERPSGLAKYLKRVRDFNGL